MFNEDYRRAIYEMSILWGSQNDGLVKAAGVLRKSQEGSKTYA